MLLFGEIHEDQEEGRRCISHGTDAKSMHNYHKEHPNVKYHLQDTDVDGNATLRQC